MTRDDLTRRLADGEISTRRYLLKVIIDALALGILFGVAMAGVVCIVLAVALLVSTVR